MQFTVDKLDDAIFHYMKDYQSILVDVNDVYLGVKQLCFEDNRIITREMFREGINKALKNFNCLEVYESKYGKYLYFYVEGKSDHHFVNRFDERSDPTNEVKHEYERKLKTIETKNASLSQELHENLKIIDTLRLDLKDSHAENTRLRDRLENLVKDKYKVEPQSYGDNYYGYLFVIFIAFICGLFIR